MCRPLKFCHFSTFYPPFSFGGDAIYLYRLANSLATQGHEVDVVHCADSYNLLAKGTAASSWPNVPGVTVHSLRSRFGPLSPLLTQQTGWPFLKARRIRQILNSKRFDVIHYHNTSLLGPKALEMAPDYTGFVKVYTTHEHWLICPMHVLWKNNSRFCDQPQCFTCTLRLRRPPQWWRYTRLLPRSADHVDVFVSPSRFTAEMHHRRGFLRPFVQLPYFTPAPAAEFGTPAEKARPFFLFVGRLEKLKGLQNVIPLFRTYDRADLLVAGSGNYEPELRRLARGIHNVTFVGWAPASQLSALYRQAIALIVPSVCYEVFPIVLLEAFSHRTPAIVNALGSLPEIIEECRGGLTYRTGEELLSAMERLRSDGEFRSQLGHNAHRTWQEKWTEHEHLRRYFDILNDTAHRKYGRLPWVAGSQGDPANSTTGHKLSAPAGCRRDVSVDEVI